MPKHSEICKHEGCNRPASGGKGYCMGHYRAWKRGVLPKARFKTCHVEGCRKRIAARGRCEEHLARDYPGKRATVGSEAS
jgi:hypothetical protein